MCHTVRYWMPSQFESFSDETPLLDVAIRNIAVSQTESGVRVLCIGVPAVTE